LEASKQVRLRVGVIGLGRLWEARHKPALVRMADRFRVTAVYDQVARRADLEAQVLGASSASGLRELLERDDVDVVYLLGPQWFGLHALELAAEIGKPIYSALPIAGPDDQIERIDARLRIARTVFFPEFARRFYPATLRLQELLATTLGPARLVVGQVRLSGFDRYGQPGPSTQIVAGPLIVDPGIYVLDWCRFVFGREPTTVSRAGGVIIPGVDPVENDVEAITAEFPEGAIAQLTIARYHRGAWGEASKHLPTPGLQVYAERGAAWLELPDRIVWTDATGTHDERLPLEPSIGETLNAHFHRAVTTGRPTTPNWDDVLAVSRLILRLG
jgi:predicted dehydrogenase